MLVTVGLMGIEVPEKYGGSGMTFVQSVLAIEEISRIEPGELMSFCGILRNKEKQWRTQWAFFRVGGRS